MIHERALPARATSKGRGRDGTPGYRSICGICENGFVPTGAALPPLLRPSLSEEPATDLLNEPRTAISEPQRHPSFSPGGCGGRAFVTCPLRFTQQARIVREMGRNGTSRDFLDTAARGVPTGPIRCPSQRWALGV